jgi:hypothetical protein
MENKSICTDCKKAKTCLMKKETKGKIVVCPFKEAK